MSGLQPGVWVSQGRTQSAGTGSDAYYEHQQATAASTWIVQHNLGKYAAIQVFGADGNLVECEVRHDSRNQVTLSFESDFSGTAVCN